MKKFILLLLMLSSTAFAKIDFNLNRVSEGGNADSLTFSREKVIEKPENFIGKRVEAPIESCDSNSLKGVDINNHTIIYEGSICQTPKSNIGVIFNLQQREMAKENKIKKIIGKIVAISENYGQNIIVKPENLD